MIKVFYFNPLRECTYVVWNDERQGVIIDPGAITVREQQRLADFVEAEGLQVKAILLTHGHFDHVFGLKDAAARWDVPVYMHHKDQSVFEGSVDFSKMLGLPYEPYEGPILDILRCAEAMPQGLEFEVLETPGHTQGCVCLYLPQDKLMFCGDTIFCGSVGRTDHPGGDHYQMIESIRREILPLPRETRLLPGHGHETTIGDEIDMNPFL
ncbi:MAG: MBL fold metallo-hydrolase [Bacteroidales bacterium]|nr:MBL fold metallo-hydrolase [Bacteroidales bacterium]